MEEYAGRVLADRYRLPLPPSDEYEFAQTRAFDTYSGQEVLVRQVPLPEIVEAEMVDADGRPEGFVGRAGATGPRRHTGGATRTPSDPAVRRAIEAAQAAAQIPDHPRLDQVFDVFAEGGSLWVVSEVVAARPLAALLAERPLSPFRAAEVAADVLTALRALHAHGWVHRNITARTVLVCDDGRIVLTGLAAGAAEEALCGYDPTPDPGQDADPSAGDDGGPGHEPGSADGRGRSGAGRAQSALPAAGGRGTPGVAPPGGAPGGAPAGAIQGAQGAHLAVEAGPGPGANGDAMAARAGAIAAYRAGARAAARVNEQQQTGRPRSLPGPRTETDPDTGTGTGAHTSTNPSDRRSAQERYTAHDQHSGEQYDGQEYGQQGHGSQEYGGQEYGGPDSTDPDDAEPDDSDSYGQIADPYGVLPPRPSTPWHGALPRPKAPGELPPQNAPDALPAAQGAPGAVAGRPVLPAAGQQGSPTPTPRPAPGPAKDAPAAVSWGQVVAWGESATGAAPRRGPATALAAERARQARMALVGPVTERWAPEQAGPVHENWQLAPPIGPETDLWALGALLFRAVQGHAPYPEESTPELVQLVCSEPPAFAEECGPLRPVVESLLRQDSTERPDFEELRGWLRSLVRSAPEPDAGTHVVTAPPPETGRLPVVRRRGEIVRRRKAGVPVTTPHGRHKRAKQGGERGPRRLGRTLLVLILLLLAAAVAYAMLFMPKAGESDRGGASTGVAGEASPTPGHSSDAGQGSGDGAPQKGPSAHQPQTTDLPKGFELAKDPEGFQVAVAEGWHRDARNGKGQIVYSKDDFELIVVPGRDSAKSFGSDPMTYQREKERELKPFRDSSWATSSGLRRIDVGDRVMAEGQFTWQSGHGGDIFVRNLAMLIDGRYHVLQVRGPESERDRIGSLYDQATATYRFTG